MREDLIVLSSMIQGSAAILFILQALGKVPAFRWGAATMSNSKMLWAVAFLCLGSVLSSGVGWYYSTYSSEWERFIKTATPRDLATPNPSEVPTHAKVDFQGKGLCLGGTSEERPKFTTYQANILDCFVTKEQADGRWRVFLIFKRPLAWDAVDLTTSDNKTARYSAYDEQANKKLPQHFGRTDYMVAEVLPEKAVTDKGTVDITFLQIK